MPNMGANAAEIDEPCEMLEQMCIGTSACSTDAVTRTTPWLSSA